MITRLGRWLVVLGVAGGLFGCAATADPFRQTDRHFLWRASDEDNSVYLMGSIHLLRDEDFPLAPVIEQAFSEAEVVVFELDMSQSVATANKLLSSGSLPPGQTLADVVSPETYERTTAALTELGLSGFSGMRPWMLAVLIEQSVLARDGFLRSPDALYFSRAGAAGKEVIALETADFQIGIFTGLSAEDSEELLIQALDDLEDTTQVDRLVSSWKRGDTQMIEDLLRESLQQAPGLFEVLIIERNRNWLPIVEDLLAGDRDAMVMVGAMHLVGEQGLTELLRAKGYPIVQH